LKPQQRDLTPVLRRPVEPAVSNWIDDDTGKLEDKLTEIVVGLAIVSERESRRWQAEMAEWQRKREAEEPKHVARPRSRPNAKSGNGLQPKKRRAAMDC
jgi:hypothetical protein